MIDAVTDSQTDEMRVFSAPPDATLARKRLPWRGFCLTACAVVVAFAICAGVGWGGLRVYGSQRRALRAVRNAVEGAAAPGEAVVVDDRLLGWALRRGHDGVLRDSVWTVSEDVSAASLLDRLAKVNRREIVVVATPDDRLIRSLDAAGFTVAQEVGWVPWDLSGRGWSLLGRGRKRIYFAVVPASASHPSAMKLREGGAPKSELH
jgi:hypothetical protein